MLGVGGHLGHLSQAPGPCQASVSTSVKGHGSQHHPGLSSKSSGSRNPRFSRGTPLPGGPEPPFTGKGQLLFWREGTFPIPADLGSHRIGQCALPSASPRHPALAFLSVSGLQRDLLCISSAVQCSRLPPNCSLCWVALGHLGRRSLPGAPSSPSGGLFLSKSPTGSLDSACFQMAWFSGHPPPPR